eukprot:5237779-Ditylum_brightwellii.AAC.1
MSATVIPTFGSSEVTITSIAGTQQITVGDYIRIDGNAYQILSVSMPIISLSSEYSGGKTGQEQKAQYTSSPGSCFDYSFDNSAESLRAHIQETLDNSPFTEDVVVSHRSFADLDGHGSFYHITFIGPAFSTKADELLVIDHRAESSCKAFEAGGAELTGLTLSIKTDMNSGTLTPGTPYYVRLAAVNSAGIGPFVDASPKSEIPRAPPGLAHNCKVYAVQTQADSLRVEWTRAEPTHGDEPFRYRVEFYEEGTVVMTNEVDSVANLLSYSIVQGGLTAGNLYQVVVVAINKQGEGGPSWFADVDQSDGSLRGLYQDYAKRSCYAMPTCDFLSEGCIEDGDFIIQARSAPKPPVFSVATYPSVSTPNFFTKDSLLVSFSSSLGDISGNAVDKFRVEWSKESTFSLSKSIETSGSKYLISSLEIGTQYFVRVKAHNSAGYGSPTNGVPAKPMQSPDPPHLPSLSILPSSSYSAEILGTSL